MNEIGTDTRRTVEAPTEGSFKDPYYDPNFNGGRMITHPLELAELEYLTDEAKRLNSLEEDETKRFPPGYVRLTKKRHYDFSSESIKAFKPMENSINETKKAPTIVLGCRLTIIDGNESGLSFNLDNPEPEHFFPMDKETANRLKEYLIKNIYAVPL